MSRFGLIVCMLAVLSAAILVQGAHGIFRQREHLDRLREKILVAESRLKSQSHNLLTDEQELSAAESQLSTLRAADAGSVTENRSRRADAVAWIARVRHVQKLFEDNPEHRVPYLRLLTDEDWLRTTLRLTFDNAMSDRNALSQLRMVAAGRYAFPLKRALNRYVTANGDTMPATVFAIAPYFDDFADAEGLNQFKIVGGNDAPWTLNLKRGPDPQNYGSLLAAPDRGEPRGSSRSKK
jgi:hypothetical protein